MYKTVQILISTPSNNSTNNSIQDRAVCFAPQCDRQSNVCASLYRCWSLLVCINLCICGVLCCVESKNKFSCSSSTQPNSRQKSLLISPKPSIVSEYLLWGVLLSLLGLESRAQAAPQRNGDVSNPDSVVTSNWRHIRKKSPTTLEIRSASGGIVLRIGEV